ncbi:DUF6514 family protein [Oscillibacter sp.]|uniref:DUF6514 family protein n=1 Tax=Oscillibacter sp. TaxID=1945593 RepID=UPI0028AA9FA4|nr:DUF6514 family protein [Oscillibacter sp.]
MRELPITTRTAQTEGNRRLTLRYILLVEETAKGLKKFGVKITEVENGTNAAAPNLTMNIQKIYGLIETLARCTVTPIGLMDVLEDWL